MLMALGRFAAMKQIEVYADIWCPFAHVGLRSVMRRREELGMRDVTVRVKAWPLELVNGAPLAVESTIKHVDELRRQVAPDLFVGFDPTNFPTTTLPALALEASAYEWDDKIGEAVSVALRNALFEDGRDISDPRVLESIAGAFGVPYVVDGNDRAVRAEWREGEARGVQGSPHFYCGDDEVFCPSLDISSNEDGSLQIRRNIEALDEFLSECFSLG
jgi:predicted DsbA family dithiol-disulfide isomerase